MPAHGPTVHGPRMLPGRALSTKPLVSPAAGRWQPGVSEPNALRESARTPTSPPGRWHGRYRSPRERMRPRPGHARRGGVEAKAAREDRSERTRTLRERGPHRANARIGVPAARVDGGEGGIRTRDGLPRTAFPVRRHSPLGDLSPVVARNSETDRHCAGRSPRAIEVGWRRGRDSNPRCFRTPLFESGTINHSDTSPRERIPKVVRPTSREMVLSTRPGTGAANDAREPNLSERGPRPRRPRTAPRPRPDGCR